MKNLKRGFTLIEMLIVVVIIGILAAALIPRLQSVQGRARDTKRKADLSQIGSALAVYKSDFGTYSGVQTARNTNDILASLVTNGSYLTAMPVDTDTSSWVRDNTPANNVSNGYYAFQSLTRNGVAHNAFVLAARTETEGTSSNWVTPPTGATTTALGGILVNTGDATNYEGTNVCPRVTIGTTSKSGCAAAKNDNAFRYIYVQ